LEKNRDALAEGLFAQMQMSSVSFLRTLDFGDSGSGAPAAGGSGKAQGTSNKKGSKMTLCAKFKLDLDSLMTALRSTVPHFIRCIKPNEKQAPSLFDCRLTLNQLKYSGLFEAIRIRKSGYSVRVPIDLFVKRFQHCILNASPQIKADSTAHATLLLTELSNEIAKTMKTNDNVATGSKGASNSNQVIDMSQRQWLVGKTRIFIRTSAFKFKMEDIRDQRSTNLAIPIQKLVRGFIMRRRYYRRVGATKEMAEKARKVEAAERKQMSSEDNLSMMQEKLFRQDYALQKRLIEAKREKMKEEQKKLARIRNTAAVKIQRIVRGKLGRTFGRVFMCEQMLEHALRFREEPLLRRAIAMPNVFGVSSKLIRVYQQNAKTLILAMLNESYVSNQIDEALTVGSIELLKDAIKLAEESKMMYLPNVKAARLQLNSTLVSRGVLAAMSAVLSRCVTVPKLLARIDLLQVLVLQATQSGFAGEPQIQTCISRLERIRNLITLRDRMRFAVEVCCPSKMHR
jgi:myosin heavy subunit